MLDRWSATRSVADGQGAGRGNLTELGVLARFRDSQVFLNTTLRTEIRLSWPQLPKNSCLWQAGAHHVLDVATTLSLVAQSREDGLK